jgi:hypothetical protein
MQFRAIMEHNCCKLCVNLIFSELWKDDDFYFYCVFESSEYGSFRRVKLKREAVPFSPPADCKLRGSGVTSQLNECTDATAYPFNSRGSCTPTNREQFCYILTLLHATDTNKSKNKNICQLVSRSMKWLDYGLEDGIELHLLAEIREIFLLQTFHTGSGAHPAIYS